MNEDNINITIIAGSWARYFIPDETTRLKVKKNADIADALALLNIPVDEIGLTVINGKAVPRDAALTDGDEIKIFPVISDG